MPLTDPMNKVLRFVNNMHCVLNQLGSIPLPTAGGTGRRNHWFTPFERGSIVASPHWAAALQLQYHYVAFLLNGPCKVFVFVSFTAIAVATSKVDSCRSR